MDEVKLQRALKLLIKADRTDYEPEAVALVERSYRLLAQVITEFDERTGYREPTGGRRERRFLFDRRRSRLPDPTKQAPPGDAGMALARYRRAAEGSDPDGRTVDMTI